MRELYFMHFQVENKETGRENIFQDKQTRNKIWLMFLYLKDLTEGTVYVFTVYKPQNKQ